jgi:8-oxo-dGTP pyrophosphatase MutT (NUDIX family)
MNFSSAGILFEDSGETDVHYLSGWNPSLNAWSGFGGKRQGEETAWQTALREVIEELFGLRVKKDVLHSLYEKITPMEFFQNGTYVCFVCPLRVIFEITIYLEGFGYKSPFYIKFPLTVYELLESRNYDTVDRVEITDLTFLTSSSEQPMDPHYKSDLKYHSESHL